MDIINKIADNIVYVYNLMVAFGINPLSIIFIILITDRLKNILKLYSGKLKSVWTMLTALFLGIIFSIFFWFVSYYTWKLMIINIIINTMASSYSTEIMNAIKIIVDKFLNKDGGKL